VDQFEPTDNAVVVGFFGPGDEIRFASFYGLLKERLAARKITVTCDPRLATMLERAFPELSFVASKRARNLASVSDFSEFRDIPGSDLIDVVDNNGWKALSCADRVMLATDFLGDFIHGYDSFAGKPYLSANPVAVSHWRDRLAKWSDQPLVGLTWRSSLATYSRNEHYLGVKELTPLLEIPGVRYVNLQYDDCSEELAYIEAHYPGKMLNFADLDQFNDLEGVAALMQCLDLVIAPATTVVELAGALGCPTLLLSNSSELHWRKRPNTRIDVWHRSVTHIEGESLGDKASLIDATAQTLLQRLGTPHANLSEAEGPGGDGREGMVGSLSWKDSEIERP
jgi:capsular polysaccharide export protein